MDKNPDTATVKTSSSNFTGDVWMNPVFGGDGTSQLTCGFGGIDLEVRELLTFSMLVALGGADAQVRGHVNGNLRVGNTRARLLAVLTVLVPFIGYPRTLNGLAALDDITGS